MLASGRVFTHKKRPNGTFEVIAADGGEMSEAEWFEYCDENKSRAAEQFARFNQERRRRNHELFEIAKHQHLIGKYARSIEAGWLGKVTDIEHRGGDVLCKMTGVDELAVMVAGISRNEALSSNDIQWFAPEDLKFMA